MEAHSATLGSVSSHRSSRTSAASGSGVNALVGADGTPSSQLWIANEVAVSLERKAITLGDRLRKMLSDAFPGRCFAVTAGPGEVVVVPPGWAHATISADPRQPLTFGAWCVRDYGFDYRDVRAHGGLAWFPRLTDDTLVWDRNPAYPVQQPLVQKSPSDYTALGLRPGVPIWRQYLADPDSVIQARRACEGIPDRDRVITPACIRM